MTIVKKTVALHPIWNKNIRRMWAKLIEANVDATYSYTLNYMLLTGYFLVINRGIDKKTKEMMVSFLKDKKVLDELNQAELSVKYFEEMKETLDYVV